MNTVCLLGRITKDVEVRYTTGSEPMAVCKFTLAVNRKGKKDEADFISCTAFGKTAETIGKFMHQGSRISVTGHIQTGSYTNKDNQKVYTTDVIVDGFDFAEDRKEQTAAPSQITEPVNDGFMQIPDNADAEFLPFN